MPSKAKIEKLAEPILRKIEESNHILLHLHPHADADSVGAALATRQVLRAKGKQVTVIAGDDQAVGKRFNFMLGKEGVVLREFGTLELKGFDLFISLDSSTPGQVTSRDKLVFPLENLFTIVIDHHVSNPGYGDLNLVIESFSSTCEILYWLFKAWGVKIDQQVAVCLYAGIWGDTDGFRYFPGTSAQTYQVAAELIRTGIDFSDIISCLTAKTTAQLKKFGWLLSLAEEYFKGAVAIITWDRDDLDVAEFSADEVQEIREALKHTFSRSSRAVITIVIYAEYQKEGEVGISLRSNNPKQRVDVSRLAEKLGGGGHCPAAGARLKNTTVQEVRERILKLVPKLYPKLKE